MLSHLEGHTFATGTLNPKPSRGFLWMEKELQLRTQAQHRPHSGRKHVCHHHNLLLTAHGAGSGIHTLAVYCLKIKQLNQLMGRNGVQDQNLQSWILFLPLDPLFLPHIPSHPGSQSFRYDKSLDDFFLSTAPTCVLVLVAQVIALCK